MPLSIPGNVNLNPAQNTVPNEQVVNNEQANVPQELANAKSSGWKTFGRVAAGIFTVGLSELIPLAWRGIKALFSRASQAPNGEPRVAGQANPLPAAGPEADKLKSALLQGFSKNTELPAQYQQAANEVLADLRNTYGSALVPEGQGLGQLFKTAANQTGMSLNASFFNAIKNSRDLVSPEGFKDLLRNNLQPMLNRQVLVNQGKEIAESMDVYKRVEIKDVIASLLRQPGLANELSNAKTPAEAAAVGEKMKLAQTLTGINQALTNTVNSMRERFGENALPGTLLEIMDRPLPSGGMLGSKITDTGFRSPINTQRVKGVLENELLNVALKNVMHSEIGQAAQEIGLHLNNRAIGGIADDLLADETLGNVLKNAKNPEDARKALDGMNLKTLLQIQKQQAEALYNQHAQSVNDAMKPLLKEFIAGLPLVGKSAEASKQYLAQIMPRFQNWDTFTGMEQGREQLNDLFKETFVDDYSKLADAPGEADKYDDSVYKSMLLDSNRSEYSINGQKIGRGNNEESTEQTREIMKREFPNEKDRQFVSKIMNQRVWASLALTHSTGILPNMQPLEAVPGATGITFAPGQGGQTVQQAIFGKPSHYTVQVSEDKTTARITVSTPYMLAYADNSKFDGKSIPYGAKTVSFTFDVNLSSHPDGQGITNVAFGQKLLSMDEYMKL